LSPIIGRLSDIFGRRNFLLLGNILAIIGTVISATTNSINTVIVGGVFIGIASGMRQLAWVALGEIVEKKNRGLAFGFMSQSISLATAFAPVIGEFDVV
jgi:MFS family permease